MADPHSSSLPYHDVSGLFPMMAEADLRLLAMDIAENGLREPIWLHPDGSILDGRNRYEACRIAGVDPVFRKWDGDGSPVTFVVSLNLHRRHLDDSQRSLVAARIANMRQGERTDLEPSANLQKVSLSDAASMMDVSERSASHAREVIASGAPELVAAVERGAVAVSAAAALTQLAPEDQAAVVALPDEERREAIRDVREGRTPHVARNSGNNEWYTPQELIDAARKVLGGIDLDPASSHEANRVVKAKEIYTADDDGLVQSWAGRVWMNPPYAQPLVSQFAEKLASEYSSKRVKAAVVLVNNATETSWFRTLAEHASAVCFPNGRVRFWAPDKASAAPLQGQAVLYLGPSPVSFHARFAEVGMVWVKP